MKPKLLYIKIYYIEKILIINALYFFNNNMKKLLKFINIIYNFLFLYFI